MAFKEIIWSKLAETELLNVLDFYIQNNGSAAYSVKLLHEIEGLINLISQNEFIGRLTANKFTRVIPIKHYAVFYEIDKNSIVIVSFWDNRQNPERNKIR